MLETEGGLLSSGGYGGAASVIASAFDPSTGSDKGDYYIHNQLGCNKLDSCAIGMPDLCPYH